MNLFAIWKWTLYFSFQQISIYNKIGSHCLSYENCYYDYNNVKYGLVNNDIIP